MNKIILLFFAITSFFCCLGQTTFSPEETDNTFKKHWSLSLNFGTYKASSYHASFYNGKPENVNNIDYIFSNYYWKQEIKNTLIENANRDSFNIESYPEKMKYNLSMLGGVSLRYNFSENLAFNIHFNFTKLHTADILNFEVWPAYPGMIESFVQGEIHGTENRSNIDISMMHAFSTNTSLYPFVELGFNLNNTLVKQSEMLIFGNTYNMIDIYGSGGYIPNNGNEGYEVRQGGIGFGLFAATGIKYAITKDIATELLVNFYYTKINLENYEDFGFQYGGLFRIIMGLDVFKSNEF